MLKIFQLIDIFCEDSQANTKRFDFLDGYRGLMALTVLMNHLLPINGSDGDFGVFNGAGVYIGVFGFFVLSAFLLTYRMLKDISKAQHIFDIVEILIKYTIRRFFRIYMPYAIYVLCLRYEIARGFYKNEFNTITNHLMLEKGLGTHLWTIPIEIKYYLLLPLITITFQFSKRLWPLLAFISCITLYSFYKENIYDPIDIDYGKTNKLYPRIPIFYSGSIVALIYFKYENWNNKLVNSILNLRLIKLFLTLSCFGMACYGISNFTPHYNPKIHYYNDSINPGVKFSIFLFVMLIGAQNSFTRLLGQNYFLTQLGKYSFGIYLWHPMCIQISKNYTYSKRLDAIAFVISLAFCVGIAFYYIIENPMMMLGNYIIKKVEIDKFLKYKSQQKT